MKAYYNEIDPYLCRWLQALMDKGLIPSGDIDNRSIVNVEAADLQGYNQCHFFAGIGGWAIAAQQAQWPESEVLWTGSPPCQPFSLVGKQRGAADDRHLWPEFFRLVRSCGPSSILGEQVAAAIGQAWLDGVFADLEGEGYTCESAIIPACAVNSPHRRDRLWFVGSKTLDHSNSTGLEGLSGDGSVRGRWPEPDRPATPPDSCHWIETWDGYARRIELSIPLLADGVPNRRERLSAYGNAINVNVAYEVIRAYMETYL